jgi:hypothetical protein
MPRAPGYSPATMEITLDSAMAALRKVMDPELHRDIVSLGMVKDLRVEGGGASLEVEPSARQAPAGWNCGSGPGSGPRPEWPSRP